MKNFITLFVILFSSILFAQSGAKIEFKDKDNTLDFGKITTKDSGKRDIVFMNTGDAPLIISDIQSTCSCLVAEKPKAPIAPGKNGVITIVYNMHTGHIRRSLTIESNATNTDQGRTLFKLRGEVVE